MNALELTEDLQSRTDLPERQAKGIVHVILTAVEGLSAHLVTNDYLDAELQTLRTEMQKLSADLRVEIAHLRVEMHQLARSQTVWLMGTMIVLTGLTVTITKL